MAFSHLKVDSPVGPLHIVSNGTKLTALVFHNSWNEFKKEFNEDLSDSADVICKLTQKQLAEYFSGRRTEFSVPLELNGTEFQTKAWRALQSIPFGSTISYGEQAKKIKNPKAVRAIGGANGRNKICIIIPCHRVIGGDGSLTGFGGGIDIKKKLLKIENAI